MVTVRYAGPRYMPMVYDIYVNGKKYNARGYRFGLAAGADTATMTREEADVLTGATPILTVDGVAHPVNGAVLRGQLDKAEAKAEAWEVLEVQDGLQL